MKTVNIRDLLWLTAAAGLLLAWRLAEQRLEVEKAKVKEVVILNDNMTFQTMRGIVAASLRATRDNRTAKGYDNQPEDAKPGDDFYEAVGKVVRCIHHYGDHIVIQWDDGSATGISPTDFREHIRGPNENDAYFADRLAKSRAVMEAAKCYGAIVPKVTQ